MGIEQLSSDTTELNKSVGIYSFNKSNLYVSDKSNISNLNNSNANKSENSLSKSENSSQLDISDSKINKSDTANTSTKDKADKESDSEIESIVISDDSPTSSQENERSELKKLLDEHNDIDEILDFIDHTLRRNCKCQKCMDEENNSLSSVDSDGLTVTDSSSTFSEYSSTEGQDWKSSPCPCAEIKEQEEIQAVNESDLFEFFHQQYEDTYETQNNVVVDDLCKIVDEDLGPPKKKKKQNDGNSQNEDDCLFDFSVFDNMASEIMTRHAKDELDNIVQDALDNIIDE